VIHKKLYFASIYGSVPLPPWKMKCTPGVNLPQLKNHWLKRNHPNH